MPNKLSFENVKAEFDKRDLILLDKEYIRNNRKMSFMNKEGYKSTITLGNLKYGKSPSYFSKHNPYTIDNIKLFLSKKGEGTILLSTNYINANELLELRCCCGEVFYRSWVNLMNQTYTTCPKCARQKSDARRKVSFDVVRYVFEKNGFTLLAKPEDYLANNTYLLCTDKDGYIGYQCYAHLASGHTNVISKFTDNMKEEHIINNINIWANKNNIDSICLGFSDTDKWIRRGIKCQCGCGQIFETSIASFMNSKNKCDKCASSKSRFEIMTMQWLNDNNIDYISEYIMSDCKDVLPLPFDFYISAQNILIEIDGQGHYHPCNFNQCSHEKAQATFEITQKHDEIKTKYCQDNNIKLIRIPYWEFDNNNYKEILFTNLIKK